MLLLRRRVQEQHKPPKGEAIEGFSNLTDALQEEAWDETLRVSQVWETLGCQRRLENPREELWQTLALRLWL